MSVKITWTCYNKDVDFFIYRSDSYINENNLPVSIAFVLKNTYEFIDENGGEHFYMIGSVFNGKLYLSSQVKAEEVVPGHFKVDVNFSYIPPAGTVEFVARSS